MRSLRAENLQEPCGLTYQQLGKLSDEQMMAHLSAGHGDAVAVLLDRYSRLVLSIAVKIVHEHAEAEDLTLASAMTPHVLRTRFSRVRSAFPESRRALKDMD